MPLCLNHKVLSSGNLSFEQASFKVARFGTCLLDNSNFVKTCQDWMWRTTEGEWPNLSALNSLSHLQVSSYNKNYGVEYRITTRMTKYVKKQCWKVLTKLLLCNIKVPKTRNKRFSDPATRSLKMILSNLCITLKSRV